MKTVRRFESSHLRHVWYLHTQVQYTSVAEWQTRQTQTLLSKGVRVQVPSDVPEPVQRENRNIGV